MFGCIQARAEVEIGGSSADTPLDGELCVVVYVLRVLLGC